MFVFDIVRNPESVDDTTKLHMSCLADYGGPVQPNVVLGGYPGNLLTAHL